MHRRYLLSALAAATLGGAAWAALPDPQPVFAVSAEQLQRVVAQRFPRRYPVQKLFDLQVQAPRLTLLPDQNRLRAEMTVQAAGPAFNRSHTGFFNVDFALRYEASDRTVRAHQLRFDKLSFPDLQPAAAELLAVYGPALAEQSLREVVLHQLRPQDLALADGLGMQPGAITVTPDGLVIGFVRAAP